ncbi:MAG: OpgC domain-containing protein, partial [Pseudomonadota bacterium]
MPRTNLQAKKPRDLRLDFFRGMAMFIILVAHTPGNTWTLWIPARLGFSDATEIFVFCSGMASSLAFGAVFAKKSWFLGAARIAFRVWQVYWAHIGVFLATALLMVALDWTGLGEEGRTYAQWPSVVRFFTRTEETMLGLFTLTFVPGLFDILPMYLVILALVPAIMAAHKFGGRWAVFGLMGALWFAAQLALFSRKDASEAWFLAQWAAEVGSWLSFLNLPSSPWSDNTWFFNPFGWQLVFFTGFAFGMKWIPAPPVNRRLVLIAAAYLLATLPLAWHKIHGAQYMPDEWLLHDWIYYFRQWIEPLRWKTGVGALRYLHFLAIAYLAWAAVGALGHRLREGWSPRDPAPGALSPVGFLALTGGGAALTATLASGLALSLIGSVREVEGGWIAATSVWIGNLAAGAALTASVLALIWFFARIVLMGFGAIGRTEGDRGAALRVLAALAVLTIPYAYVDEIKWAAPWLDRAIFSAFEPLGLLLPENRIGMAQLVHLFALLPLVWAAIGSAGREWTLKDGFLSIVPIIRKVGTQSLAVFMVSIVLSRFSGWWMDVI